jgi:hypothetical protein
LNSSHKKTADPFVLSTHGSHHIRLINHNANLFNSLHDRRRANHLKLFPVLPLVPSHEKFGIVPSDHAESFGGLLEIKEEESDDDNLVRDILEGVEMDVGAGLGDLKMEGLLTMDEVGEGEKENSKILAIVSNNISSNGTSGRLQVVGRMLALLKSPEHSHPTLSQSS